MQWNLVLPCENNSEVNTKDNQIEVSELMPIVEMLHRLILSSKMRKEFTRKRGLKGDKGVYGLFTLCFESIFVGRKVESGESWFEFLNIFVIC